MSADAVAERPSLETAVAGDPGVVIERLAAEYGVRPRAVVEALPLAMRQFVPGDAFLAIMNDVAQWGEVTLIVHTDDGIFEYTGQIPAGDVSRGYYNVPGRAGFHGHLRHDRCSAIAFVERPFMGRLSASILFLNVGGAIMFKIFVGRDEKRELLADQLARFRALRGRLTTGT
jgi:putative heme utilization carrier protein HutX